MRDPKRPYAQLLTPAAKSQKLLLRLQHSHLLPTVDITRSQAVFTLWQKLLAKNIPSTPWPHFADLLLYPDNLYLPLLVWPFPSLAPLEQAVEERYVSGLLLVDCREEAPLLAIREERPVVAGVLADRLGIAAWQLLSKKLTPWQKAMIGGLSLKRADAVIDLIGMLRKYSDSPWPGAAKQAPAPDLAEAFFALWRAGGAGISERRLLEQGLGEAAAWLADGGYGVCKTADGYVLCRDEEMVQK